MESKAEDTNTSDKKKIKKYIKIISIIGIILCVIGLADTTYLTIAHYTTKVTLACPTKGIINCEKVTSSSYSEVFGIPVSIPGFLFFFVMLIFQLPMVWRIKNGLVRLARVIFASIGLLTVFWFVYVEFHKLDAICLYCTLVHVLTFSLFVVTIVGTSIIPANDDK